MTLTPHAAVSHQGQFYKGVNLWPTTVRTNIIIMDKSINVCITGAAGQIAYSLIPMVCKGDVFGPDQHIKLSLLDIPPMMGVLKGVEMEMMDCAFPLVDKIVSTDDPNKAFVGAQAVFLVGAMPRKQGMERKDLLSANVKIFKEQGHALDQYAHKEVKILVVGNPANTNAAICSTFAPSISKKNFTCLTRLDQNRAQAQIAAKAGVLISDVKGVIIWGNHSSTQFPDVSHATVKIGEATKPVTDVIKDESFLKDEFIKTVQQRGAAVIAARKLSSAMSAAKASADHMRDWWHGTDGRWVSMGVFYNGGYKLIPPNVVYSVPVTIDGKGNWTAVEGLALSAFAEEKMSATAKELKEEKQIADEVTGAAEQQTKGGH